MCVCYPEGSPCTRRRHRFPYPRLAAPPRHIYTLAYLITSGMLPLSTYHESSPAPSHTLQARHGSASSRRRHRLPHPRGVASPRHVYTLVYIITYGMLPFSTYRVSSPAPSHTLQVRHGLASTQRQHSLPLPHLAAPPRHIYTLADIITYGMLPLSTSSYIPSNLPRGFQRFGFESHFRAGVFSDLGYGLGLLRAES